jgi:hypothetical protein
MNSPPCHPRTPDGGIAVCARIVSQHAAKEYARFGGIPPRNPNARNWGALCPECWDNIALLGGNARAVIEEWTED